MQIGRRQLFASALGAAALAPLTKATAASTQTTTPPPSPDERLAARASEVRRRLSYDGRAFSGPAWDFLLSQGRAANFFMLGEEHGIAENAKMAAALFRALVPSGYSRVAIETSPQSALELDRVARSGLPGLRTYLSDQANTVASSVCARRPSGLPPRGPRCPAASRCCGDWTMRSARTGV